MNDAWFTTTLGEQLSLQRGIDITKEHQRAGLVPVVSSGGISSYHDTSISNEPGVVLGRKGNVGTVFWLNQPYWPHDTTLWVTDFKGNVPRFVYYFFSSKTKLLKSLDVGTANPALNRNHLYPIRILWPPVGKQQTIAHVLGTLDDSIEQRQKMNKALETMASALFKSWFVDFDPVIAKSEGRKQSTMDATTALLFPSSFVDSEIGTIPAGWRVEEIRSIVEDVYDGPHATPPEATSGAVFLGIRNFTGTQLDLSDIRYIAEQDWAKWTRRVTPRALDIVFTYEATLGFFALIPPGLRCCLGRRTALVRPRQDDFMPHFLYHSFVSPDFQEMLISRANTGSTVDRIPLIDFPGYKILWPHESVRERFEQIAAPLWARIHHNQAQIGILRQMRDTLLPKLISGEIRLKDAEKIVEEAT